MISSNGRAHPTTSTHRFNCRVMRFEDTRGLRLTSMCPSKPWQDKSNSSSCLFGGINWLLQSNFYCCFLNIDFLIYIYCRASWNTNVKHISSTFLKSVGFISEMLFSKCIRSVFGPLFGPCHPCFTAMIHKLL